MTPAQAQHEKDLAKLLKGDRPLSQMETLCIERLINDHKRAKSAGLVWNEDKAMQAVLFFDLLQHYKGKFAGQPLSLQPWQRDCIVKPLFGWYREDGSRRYRQSYIEVPRKNGKTTMTAGFALKGLLMDGEQGAEVYAAATKREQAKILFDDCGKVLGPAIKKRVRVLKNAITFEQMNASLKAVSSDYNTLDGLNPHICVVDELHAHKERGLYDVMMSGMGARFSPLMVAITTAGVDRASICWEQREILRNAIEGHVEHDAYHGYVATIDEGDDWEDPLTWHKANPNLGISIYEDSLADFCRSAKVSGSAENNFRRKHLDQWVGQAERWIGMDKWDACEDSFSEEDMEGLPCWAAVDLAETRDLNAMAIVWRRGEDYYVKTWFWAPKEAMDERAAYDRRQVVEWMHRGQIASTYGQSADHESIAAQVNALFERHQPSALVFDPHISGEFLYHLRNNHGFPEDKLCKFNQTIMNYSAPCKSFETLIYQNRLKHDGNPVLRWNISNLAAYQDANANIRPDKKNSADKIDGAVATIMALGEAIHGETGVESYGGAMWL